HHQLALGAFAGGELEHHPGRLRRLETHADQVEEGEEVLLRHLVQPVDDHLRHPGVELEDGDAGVGGVVVGPLRAVARDQAHGLVHDLLPGAVVEIGYRERHDGDLYGTLTTGMTGRSWGVQGGASSPLVEAPKAPDRKTVGEGTRVISMPNYR